MLGTSEPPVHVEISRRDIIKYSVSTEQVLEKYLKGAQAPPLFLFGALRPVVAMDQLGPDGLATLSLTPELPLQRVMAGGNTIRYFRPVRPGDNTVATPTLAEVSPKSASQEPLIFHVQHTNVK